MSYSDDQQRRIIVIRDADNPRIARKNMTEINQGTVQTHTYFQQSCSGLGGQTLPDECPDSAL